MNDALDFNLVRAPSFTTIEGSCPLYHVGGGISFKYCDFLIRSAAV